MTNAKKRSLGWLSSCCGRIRPADMIAMLRPSYFMHWPTSSRQRLLARERRPLGKSGFIALIAAQGGDAKAADFIWENLQQWICWDGYTVYPEDRFHPVLGIAEEEVEVDILERLVDASGVSDQQAAAVWARGFETHALDFCRFARALKTAGDAVPGTVTADDEPPAQRTRSRISLALLRESALLMANPESSPQEIEDKVKALLSDDLLARRVLDWIPEAFGWLLISRIADVMPPNQFQARTEAGEWKVFPLDAEPLFAPCLQLGLEFCRDGSPHVFKALAVGSALVNGLDNALNAGAKMKGAVLSGPTWIALRAELYEGGAATLDWQ